VPAAPSRLPRRAHHLLIVYDRLCMTCPTPQTPVPAKFGVPRSAGLLFRLAADVSVEDHARQSMLPARAFVNCDIVSGDA